MELVMAAVVGVLFASGTYLILRPNLIRMVMGITLYSNAANLMMIACGGYQPDAGAPFVAEGEVNAAAFMDPLPPDIILTAIVINFAVGALLLTLCYRVYLDHGTDNPEMLPTDDPDDDDDLAAQPPAVFDELSRPDADAPHESSPDIASLWTPGIARN